MFSSELHVFFYWNNKEFIFSASWSVLYSIPNIILPPHYKCFSNFTFITVYIGLYQFACWSTAILCYSQITICHSQPQRAKKKTASSGLPNLRWFHINLKEDFMFSQFSYFYCCELCYSVIGIEIRNMPYHVKQKNKAFDMFYKEEYWYCDWLTFSSMEINIPKNKLHISL